MWEEREETHRRHETQNWSQKLSHKLCLKTKSKNKQKLFYKSWKGTGKFYRWIWDTNVKFLSSVIVLKYYTLTQPLRFQKYILGNSLNVENNHSLTDGHFFFNSTFTSIFELIFEQRHIPGNGPAQSDIRVSKTFLLLVSIAFFIIILFYSIF